MRTSIYRLLVISLVLQGLVLTSVARPQALLKLRGESAESLVPRALQADADIRGQFATTTLTLTYENRSYQRLEAMFHYAAPPGSVITGFAYWYGDEKVIARVVEKKRAAAIYKAITDRLHDPALVEMVAPNILHARIFPVMPNADLRVEIRYVQLLSSSPKGAFYTLPLPKQLKPSLEAVRLHAIVHQDAGLSDVLNNLGLPVTKTPDAYEVSLNARGYRPKADLRVHAIRRVAPLRAELFAAPSGGADGFFALALTADRAVHAPRVAIQGVQPYSLLPARLPDLAANRAQLVVGRYRGSGLATVTLTGRGSGQPVRLTAPVRFSADRQPQNLAAKLWASARIQQLGTSGAHRAEVIALSVSHTIPSRFTSWLAIPQEERDIMARDQAYRKAGSVAEKIAELAAAGKARSPEAQQMMARIQGLAAAAQTTAADLMQGALYGQMADFASQIVTEQHSPHPSATRTAEWKRRLAEGCELFEASPDDFLRAAENQQMQGQMQALSGHLGRLVMAGRGQSTDAEQTRARLETLAETLQMRPDSYLRDAIYQDLNRVASQLVAERRREHPDANRLAALQTQLDNGCSMFRGNPDEYVRDADTRWIGEQLNTLSDRLATLIRARKGDTPTAQTLRAKAEELIQGHEGNWRYWLVNSLWNETHGLAEKIVEEQRQPAPNTARIARWRAQLEYVCRYTNGHTADEYIREADRNMAWSELWRVRARLETALNAYARDDAHIGMLKQRLGELGKRLGQGPGYAEHAFEVVKVRADIARLERRVAQADPEERPALKEQLNQALQLSARIGDPLIHVEAPADAVRVVAVMPDGTIKPLAYNATVARWEARFDIPAYAHEGSYRITIFIVLRDGTRRVVEMPYQVDLTPPRGSGAASLATDPAPTVRLEITADPDTARVEATLPWGELVPMRPASEAGRFFALAPVPAGWKGDAVSVTYTLTDRAHNRTTITVEMVR